MYKGDGQCRLFKEAQMVLNCIISRVLILQWPLEDILNLQSFRLTIEATTQTNGGWLSNSVDPADQSEPTHGSRTCPSLPLPLRVCSGVCAGETRSKPSRPGGACRVCAVGRGPDLFVKRETPPECPDCPPAPPNPLLGSRSRCRPAKRSKN